MLDAKYFQIKDYVKFKEKLTVLYDIMKLKM